MPAAVGLAQLQHLAHRQMVEQLVRQAPAGLALDRQLDTAIAVHGGQAVAAAQARALVRHVQLHMLAGPPATGVAVAAQGQGQHVFGHPLARLDLGQHPVQAPGGVQGPQKQIDICFAQPGRGAQPPQGL